MPQLAGVAKWGQVQLLKDVHPQRPTLLRVLAPRLEQAEPSPPDEVPVTRARYTAGTFAPPAKRATPGDTARTTSPSRSGVQHSPHLVSVDDPFQRTVPMTDKQLEEFSTMVLGSSSSIWSAEARNQPASTSDAGTDVEVPVHSGQKSVREWSSVLAQLCFRGDLDAALRLLQELDKSLLQSVSRRFRHKLFLNSAAENMKSKAAVQFAKLVTAHQLKPEVLVTDVLQVCAKCRDVDSGLHLIEWARKNGLRVDTRMLTTLMKVCKSVGNVDQAFRLYQEMRAGNHKVDAHVVGALIATHAEAMKRDLTVVHERKDQYVLLERAFQLVEDADKAGIALPEPVWNALIMCAGRSGEVNRAFHALSMMQRRSVDANAVTYGSLIESCVCAGHSEQALRVYEVALQKGFVSEVKLYTSALSACMRPVPSAWERAMDIYAAMQRASVRPDKKFFACLIAVAGRCGRLDTAFELLSEMAAEGIPPSSTSMSALIRACLIRGNLTMARRVYDLCAKQGVYPVLSQFNHLMDVYASEFRFGEVVSLVCDMVAAGRQPNLNTYRILIDACTFTDQGGLAFQVFALMHANRISILQEKFAQTIYYMLVKACFNQTRFLWAPPGGYPPVGPLDAAAAGAVDLAAAVQAMTAGSSGLAEGALGGGGSSRQADSAGAGTSAPGSFHSQQQQQKGGFRSPLPAHQPHHHAGPPPERRLEAEKLLAALGAHKLRRGAHQSDPFEGPPDTIDWASHAISAFHHMLNRGFRPTLELLDLLLNCMRGKMLPETELDAPNVGLAGRGPAGAAAAARGQMRAPFIPRRSRNDVFEMAFENRAFVILDEAINRGLLPRYDLDAPLVVDMRRMPPTVSEVYVLHMLVTLERRDMEKKAKAVAAAAAAAGTAASSSGLMAAAAAAVSVQSYHHPITLLVPSFDPDLVKFPSYLDRVMNRYTATLSPDEQIDMRRRYRRRSRASQRRSRSRSPPPVADRAASGAGTSSTAPNHRRRMNDTMAHGPAANGANGHAGNGVNGAGRNGSTGDAAAATANGAAAAPQASTEHDLAALTEDRFVDGRLRDPWDEDVQGAMYSWASVQQAEDEHEAEAVEEEEEEDIGADPAGGRYVADSTTGLAVAATLQRMKVWMDMDYVSGTITIASLEVMRFLKRRREAALAAATMMAEERAAEVAARGAAGPGAAQQAASGAPGGPAGTPGGVGGPTGGYMAGVAGGMAVGSRLMGGLGGRGPAGSPVEMQQRNIRLGMGLPSHGAAGPAPHFQHVAPPAGTAREGRTSAGGGGATGGDSNAGAGPGSLALSGGPEATAAAATAAPSPRSRPAPVHLTHRGSGSQHSSRAAAGPSGQAAAPPSQSQHQPHHKDGAPGKLVSLSPAESRRRGGRDAARSAVGGAASSSGSGHAAAAAATAVPGAVLQHHVPEAAVSVGASSTNGVHGSSNGNGNGHAAHAHHATEASEQQQLQRPRWSGPGSSAGQLAHAVSESSQHAVAAVGVSSSAEVSVVPGHPVLLSMAAPSTSTAAAASEPAVVGSASGAAQATSV